MLALSLLLLSSAASELPAPVPEERPNVLFLAVDDLNDWVGALQGHPDAETPHLDRLAARGVLFTNAHCASPLCGPSRAAVLTGLRPETTGCYGNAGTWADYVPDAVSLPRHLQAQGYRVLGAGKVNHGLGLRIPQDWHEYGPGCGVVGTPFTDGELACAGMLPARRVRRGALDCTLPMNGGLSLIDRPANQWDTFDWGPLDLPASAFPDGEIAAWGAEQLSRDFDSPFFLALGIYKPHQPFFLPRPCYERFDPASIHLPPTLAGDLHDVPAAGRDLATRAWTSGTHATVVRHGRWREAVAAYLAAVHFADARVGEVVDALDRSGYADDTWILLWSDHGWSLGEKEHWGKHVPWRESVRVPLIAVPPAGAAPAGFRPGTRCAAPVSLLDLYPTVLDLCGLPPRPELEGRSLLPLIADVEAPWEEAVVATVGRGTHSVFAPGWRYVRWFDGTEELYELAADPREWRNRAGDPRLAAVKQRLAAHIPEDPTIHRTVRWGRWKCVLRADGEAQLFDLHAPMGIAEQEDLAAARPQVVTDIRRRLDRLGARARRVHLAAPEEMETVELVVAGELRDDPLLVGRMATEEGALRARGRGSKLLFSRAPGTGDFALRAELQSAAPDGESAAVRIGQSLLGLHDGAGRLFLEGSLFAGLEAPGALADFVDPDEGFELVIERAADRLRVGLDGQTVLSVQVPSHERIDLLGFHPAFADLRLREVVLEGEELVPARLPSFTIPWTDLDGRADLQVVVDRDPDHYLGHPSSVLLEDGRTMVMMFLEGHARAALRWHRSEDAGRSWTRQPVPEGWNEVPAGWKTPFQEVPILYRLTDPDGRERVHMFTGTRPIRRAFSEDDGHTWSKLEPLGEDWWGGIVVFADMMRLSDGSYLATLHDDGRFLGPSPGPRGVPRVYTMRSKDGGMSWTEPELTVAHPVGYLCEAGMVRSPDGARIAMLMRENSHALCSYVSFSDDEGATWSPPRQLPAALTGDRHQAVYLPDGRLLISFRDTLPASPTWGDWVGWVGTFADIEAGREGEYRLRFKDNLEGADCAYPSLHVFPDGTLFAATYGHWIEGEVPYVLSFRFTMEDLDASFAGESGR